MNWEIVGIILLIAGGTTLALYLLAKAVVALKLWWKSLTPTPTVITTPPPGGAGPATGSATSPPTTTPTSLFKWGTIPPSATHACNLVLLASGMVRTSSYRASQRGAWCPCGLLSAQYCVV